MSEREQGERLVGQPSSGRPRVTPRTPRLTPAPAMAAGTLANSMNWAFWLCNGPAPWVSPRGSTARVRRHIIRTCHEMSAYQHSVTLKYNTQLAKQPRTRWRTRKSQPCSNRVARLHLHEVGTLSNRLKVKRLATPTAGRGATRLRVPVGCSVLVCVYDGIFQHPGSRRTAPRSQPTGVGVPDVDVPPATSDVGSLATCPAAQLGLGRPVTPVMDLAVLAL